MIATNIATLRSAHRGVIPEFAQIGCYPLYYIHDGKMLCADCTEHLAQDEELVFDIMFENSTRLECDNCGKILQAAYESEEAV